MISLEVQKAKQERQALEERRAKDRIALNSEILINRAIIEEWRAQPENRHECYADGAPIYKMHESEVDPLCMSFGSWIWEETSDYLITIAFCPYCGLKLK